MYYLEIMLVWGFNMDLWRNLLLFVYVVNEDKFFGCIVNVGFVLMYRILVKMIF